MKGVCDRQAKKIKALTHKVEVSVLEMLQMLLTIEGEDPIELDFNEEETHNFPISSKSRRPSIAAVEFLLPPGEKTAAKKKQQREELRQEGIELMNHFNRKMVDGLVRSVRSTLEKLRHSLLSPLSISYGQASEKEVAKKPIIKLKLSLQIPTIAISPPLDEVQGTVNHVNQTILQVFKEIYQWGQLDLQAVEEQGSNLASPSTVGESSLPIKKPELKTFFRTIAEHKEVAKLVSSLSSIISSTKTVVMGSFSNFDVYKDLWQQEQEKKVTEFMETEPLVSDFENELHYFENLEGDISAEEDFTVVGPLYLDASEYNTLNNL